MGTLTDWLDRTEAEHTTDHPYCTGCPLTRATAALRAVLSMANDADPERHECVGNEASCSACWADDIRLAIATALGVTP